MENAYAQALWRLLKEGMKPKEAIAGLCAVLERHGRMRILPRVARAFARIAAREGTKSMVTLTLARAEDEQRAHKEIKEFLEDMKVSPEDIVVKKEENLIGGWRLEGKERLVDASFRKHLLSLYNRATT